MNLFAAFILIFSLHISGLGHPCNALVEPFERRLPEFDCEDGSTVFSHQVCNGFADCRDSSDESSSICRYTRCSRHQFRCSYGACVAEEKECDGYMDCLDESDEKECGVALNACGKNEYKCRSGKCIPKENLCDGRVHCPDDSDESPEACRAMTCPANTFRCTYGACVPQSAKCNGSADCKDGSDEASSICKSQSEKSQCKTDQFSCKTGECVEEHQVCDGQKHCSDASDENSTLCEKRQCGAGRLRCRSGQCLAASACDGRAECADGTDEHPWLCASGSCGDGGCVVRGDSTQKHTSPASPSCRLPPLAAPQTRYTVDATGCSGGPGQCRAGAAAPEGSALVYTCDQGHELIGPAKVSCVNATWQPLPLPACVPVGAQRVDVSCAALVLPTGIEATCEAPRSPRGRGPVPCDKSMPMGTLATFNCPQFYLPLDPAEVADRAVCQRDGTWSSPPPTCKPECGKMGPEITPLIVNGLPSQYGMWPWLAALYVRQSEEWIFWCGGSLLSDSVILTAAHCAWNQNPEQMRVAFGKFYSSFERKQDMTQIREVKQIALQTAYQDQLGNYGSDIALLFLSTPVNLTLTVRPVCIDWNLEYIDQHLTDNNTGLIFGWGVTENDTHSESLRKTTLTVRGPEHCIAEQSRDFKKYITFTTFCAGFTNGTGVCNGDSGGGLVFPLPHDNETWMLQGLVSVSPRRRGTSFCDPTKYTVFTKVGIYVKWMKSVLSSMGIILWN